MLFEIGEEIRNAFGICAAVDIAKARSRAEIYADARFGFRDPDCHFVLKPEKLARCDCFNLAFVRIGGKNVPPPRLDQCESKLESLLKGNVDLQWL